MSRDADGCWIAAAVELPHCWSRAATRNEALHKLRDEIRYRIELCPCSAVDEEFVQVELVAGEATVHSRSFERRANGAGGRIDPTHLETGISPPRGWRRWDD